MSIADGSWERRPEHLGARARLFGVQHASAAAAAAAVRSRSVALASVRAARRALALRVSATAAAERRPAHVNETLDAWLGQAVLVLCRAAGVDPTIIDPTRVPPQMALHIRPAAAGNEFGALVARIQRAKGDWRFPQLDAALTAVSAKERRRGPAAHRSPSDPCWPREVWLYLESREWKSPKERTMAAAMALASALGLPIELTRMVEVAHVKAYTDPPTGKQGVALTVPPRPQGRKVHQRRAVLPDNKTARTGAAGPLVHKYFLPWWRLMRDKGSRFVFPKFTARSTEQFEGDEMVGARMLREALYQVPRGDGRRSQWHDLRRGLEHAIDRVHLVAGGLKAPVPEDVKNAITLRSNLKLRGSRDTYIHESVCRLFEATRHVHEVAARLDHGLVLEEGVEPAPEDAPFDTACAWCGAELDAEDGDAALCDAEGCLWALCRECWSHPPEVPLWCPAHEGQGDSDNDTSDADDDEDSDDDSAASAES